jgi:hypothetical protein
VTWTQWGALDWRELERLHSRLLFSGLPSLTRAGMILLSSPSPQEEERHRCLAWCGGPFLCQVPELGEWPLKPFSQPVTLEGLASRALSS